MIKTEETIRSASGTKTKTKQSSTERRQGKYPEVEKKLASWIRSTREFGIPVETWMLPLEGQLILDTLYPGVVFNFGNRWRKGFFKRENFSFRHVTSRNVLKRKILAVVDTIADWHVATRAHQADAKTDSMWGRTPPTGVFNHDQVPIALASDHSRTIDTVGKEVIFDSTTNDSETKRFCSLNLFIPMELLPDLSNLPKPHLVFKATEFCEGKDWVGKRDSPGQQLERDLWSKDVIVSFQENAWVDARTTIYSLQEQTNLEKGLQQADIKNPQIFEDCLAAHTTPEVLAYWKSHKPHWDRRSLPKNLTWCTQPIDRHIGIQYKTAVYRAIREECLKRIKACTGD
jgi:hypothetical protein